MPGLGIGLGCGFGSGTQTVAVIVIIYYYRRRRGDEGNNSFVRGEEDATWAQTDYVERYLLCIDRQNRVLFFFCACHFFPFSSHPSLLGARPAVSRSSCAAQAHKLKQRQPTVRIPQDYCCLLDIEGDTRPLRRGAGESQKRLMCCAALLCLRSDCGGAGRLKSTRACRRLCSASHLSLVWQLFPFRPACHCCCFCCCCWLLSLSILLRSALCSHQPYFSSFFFFFLLTRTRTPRASITTTIIVPFTHLM